MIVLNRDRNSKEPRKMLWLVKLFIESTVLFSCFGSDFVTLTRLLKSVFEVSFSDDAHSSPNSCCARSKDCDELGGSGLSWIEHRNEFSKVRVYNFFDFGWSNIGFLKDLSKDFSIYFEILISFSNCIFPNLYKFLTITHKYNNKSLNNFLYKYHLVVFSVIKHFKFDLFFNNNTFGCNPQR
jgi:hypothetical protein